MAIANNKKRIAISIDEEKARELKKKAVDADMSFSEFLTQAGSQVDPIEMRQQKYSGGIATQE